MVPQQATNQHQSHIQQHSEHSLEKKGYKEDVVVISSEKKKHKKKKKLNKKQHTHEKK